MAFVTYGASVQWVVSTPISLQATAIVYGKGPAQTIIVLPDDRISVKAVYGIIAGLILAGLLLLGLCFWLLCNRVKKAGSPGKESKKSQRDKRRAEREERRRSRGPRFIPDGAHERPGAPAHPARSGEAAQQNNDGQQSDESTFSSEPASEPEAPRD